MTASNAQAQSDADRPVSIAVIGCGVISDQYLANLTRLPDISFANPGHDLWHPNPDFLFQTGGGPLLDMGPYYLTALTLLLGPVRGVAGFGRRAPAAGIAGARGMGVLDMVRSLRAGTAPRASAATAPHVLDVMETLTAAAAGGQTNPVTSTCTASDPLSEDWNPLARGE